MQGLKPFDDHEYKQRHASSHTQTNQPAQLQMLLFQAHCTLTWIWIWIYVYIYIYTLRHKHVDTFTLPCFSDLCKPLAAADTFLAHDEAHAHIQCHTVVGRSYFNKYNLVLEAIWEPNSPSLISAHSRTCMLIVINSLELYHYKYILCLLSAMASILRTLQEHVEALYRPSVMYKSCIHIQDLRARAINA